MAETAQKSKPADAVGLEAMPRAGQIVEHAGKHLTTIKEGLAYILVPEDAPTSLDPKAAKNGLVESQSVFYNPIQQFNRDLSVLAIKAYGEDLMQLRKSRAEAKARRANQRVNGKGRRGIKRKADEAMLSPVPAVIPEGSSRMSLVQEDNQAATSSSSDQRVSSTTDHGTVVDGMLTGDELDVDHGVPIDQTAAADESTMDLDKLDSQSHPKDENGKLQEERLHYKTSFKILDALSATGLRALRYAHEIPFATSVTANDLSQKAVNSIHANVEHNKLEGKVRPLAGNALSHMYHFIGRPTEGEAKHEGRYDVIDLDPYGTAVPFLDAAMHALNDGGLLCVTCTDAGVWASSGYPEKAYSLYGGTPMKGLHSHEGGLRLILHAIASSAARHGMSIEPLLSLSIDFYARVFVRVYMSAAEVKMLAGKTMLVYSCDSGCGAWQTQFLVRNLPLKGKDGKTNNYKHSLGQGPTTGPHCEHCGFKLHMSGPMYGGPLHNTAFIEAILSLSSKADKATYATVDRIEGMLTTALEETLLEDDSAGESTAEQKKDAEISRSIPRADAAQIDPHPFFFIPNALAKVLRCQAPAESALRGALKHAGYQVTRSHAKPGTIRTSAPWSFVWEMMREWVRQKAPIKDGAIKAGTAGWGIMRGSNRANGQKGNGEAEAANAAVQSTAVEVDGGSEQGQSQGQLQPQPQPQPQASRAVDAAVAGSTGAVGAAGRRVVFDEKLGREAGRRRLVRYQTNPRANWGPMNRAGGRGKAKGASADEAAS